MGKESQAPLDVHENDLLEITVTGVKSSSIEMDPPRVRQDAVEHCKRPYEACFAGKWVSHAPPGFHISFTPAHRDFMNQHPEMFHNSGTVWWARSSHYRGHVGCTGDLETYLPLPNLPFKVGTGFFPPPFVPSYYRWECRDLRRNQCDPGDREEKWRKTTLFHTPGLAPTWVSSVLNEEEYQKILSQLNLQFRWKEGEGSQTQDHEMSCPLRDFSLEVLPAETGQFRLAVTLKNTRSCFIFNESNRRADHAPQLSVVNSAFLEKFYRCGALVEEFTGARVYRCPIEETENTRRNGIRNFFGRFFPQEETLRSTREQDESILERGSQPGLWRRFYPRMELSTKLRRIGAKFQTLEEWEER